MNLKKIFQAFPPPKFLDIPFAGLSIHDSAVRLIKFGKKDEKLFIEKYAEKALPPGAINSGEVNNKEELIHVLETLKKEHGLDYVKVSMPEEKAYLFAAKIPKVGDGEIKSAVESKIEENVPVPPGELIFDYRVVDSSQSDILHVVVSNLPISVVDKYVEIVNLAGLTPLSLEIESQAIARALISPDSTDTVLIVNFGADKVGLYVASSRVIHFTSTIQTKGNVAADQEFLLHEIKKLYTYWHTLKDNVDNPSKKIQEIIICGENIPDEVVLGNVWTNAFDVNADIPTITFNDSLKYVTAVGLALPTKTLIL